WRSSRRRPTPRTSRAARWTWTSSGSRRSRSTAARSSSGGCRAAWAAPTAASTGPATSRSSSRTRRRQGQGKTMGHKTHPIGFRLGIIKTWSSKWYEEKNYSKWLHEDLKLKDFIRKKLVHAGVSYIDVERAA